MSYKREDVQGPRGKLLDVVFILYPNGEFVREVKAANKRRTDGERVTNPVAIGRGSTVQGSSFGSRVAAPKR